MAVGLPHDFAATPEGEDGPTLARRAAAAGAFVGIAHPQWYGLDFTDGLALDAAHAVEIYNHTCEMLSARPDGVVLFDDLMTRGKKLSGFASDDAHFHSNDSFGGWVQVKSETLEPEALLAALKAGNYYASTGPEIVSIERDGVRLSVAASPVRSIVLAGPGAKSAVVHGEAITTAELDLSHFAGGWCRVVVTDINGKRAWAQPFEV